MLSFHEFYQLLEGPLTAQVQAVKGQYDPSNTFQRCGNCGQPVDIRGIQSKTCSVCGNQLNQNPNGLQNVEGNPNATVQHRVITPDMEPKIPFSGSGWAARRS